jgi:hypothetical protein
MVPLAMAAVRTMTWEKMIIAQSDLGAEIPLEEGLVDDQWRIDCLPY